MRGSGDDALGIDPGNASPLSSQVIGQWGSLPATVDTAEAATADAIHPISRLRSRTAGRLFRSPKFLIGFAFLGLMIALAALAPLIDAYNPLTQNFSALNQNPNPAHWLGTDYLGRDIWSRLVWGGRTSLTAGVAVVALGFVVGVPWGIVAGLGGKVVDDILMRLVDVLLAFPGLVLAYTIIAFIGTGIVSVVIALGVAGLPGYARVARASTLSTKNLDYIEAARAQGGNMAHIMRFHIFPNIVDPLVILATLNLAGAILATSALSFLGIGTQLPGADWGTMLSLGFNYYFESWAQVVFPALFIIIAAFGINLMGDGLGEVIHGQSQRG